MADDTTPHTSITPPAEPETVVADQVRQAIEDAGGNPDLLLPHLTSQLGWRRDGEAITVFSGEKEGAEACRDLVARLQNDPRFEAAFAGQSEAASQPDENLKFGSGAMPTAGFQAKAIPSRDPLAIGQALHDIAQGSVAVNFNG